MLYLTGLPSGVKEAIGKIMAEIDNGAEVPRPLRHLLCGYDKGEQIAAPPESDNPTPAERIALVGGESNDVLLALPANREQLEIARKIGYSDAVLVQGPPGTGKTHTIANLLGSLLAQGKRVLVTSATDKALTVLRDKLPPVIQPLCVTLLDSNSGSATENLRRAVEGISSTVYSRGYDVASLTNRSKEQQQLRQDVLSELTDVRQKLYAVCDKESADITFMGQAKTLTEWAKWLHTNERLGLILPDPVSSETLSVSTEELKALYLTNSKLSAQDAAALQGWLPTADTLPTASDVREWLLDKNEYEQSLENSPVHEEQQRHHVLLTVNGITLKLPKKFVKAFRFDEAAVFENCSGWQRAAQIDGMLTADAGLTVWDVLDSKAQAFIQAATERRRDINRKNISIDSKLSPAAVRAAVNWFLENAPNGRVSFFANLFNRDTVRKHLAVISQIFIDNQPPASRQDFEAVLAELQWVECHDGMIECWDQHIGAARGPLFASLGARPEVEMPKFLQRLKTALHWWKTYGDPIRQKVSSCGLDPKEVFGQTDISSNEAWRDAIWDTTRTVLLPISRYLKKAEMQEALESRKQKMLNAFTAPEGSFAAALVEPLRSAAVTDSEAYARHLNELARLTSLKDVADKREELLIKLAESAPKWAQAISSRQEGWSQEFVPDEIYSALHWNAVNNMLQEHTNVDYQALQSDAYRLSRKFREISAELAATLSWLHLARRITAQPNLMQSLAGWMTTVKKIGKGSGKRAAKFQAQARQQAKDCQEAIPIWVMTTQRALTTLNPKEKFDIIIVDEASQSDVSALAVLFMGEQVVVVGDDQQVSPMGVGVSTGQITNLQETYLGDIRNSGIYDESTSLYDIIKTVSTPVMLKEHFRCAKEIIGFSNDLSYNGAIRPLRDMSKCPIRPHLVSYRVDGRRTEAGTNVAEAKAIVSLIKSCIEQDEYKDKTFGVISMFSGKGQSQAELIDRMLKEAIPTKEYERRRISVGIPANFQGDERDVIFLSLVQNRTSPDSLIRKLGDGARDSNKKRYNVAASRARDQLWVIHSFDPSTDLAPDDLRAKLLSHVANPNGLQKQKERLKKKAESPFEEEVGARLTNLGYKLEAQRSVGSYRLDLVVQYKDRSVALECDGERYHSSPEQIIQDMERQATLERNGWEFVRVRGSEFYRDPDAAIDRVCKALAAHGILPDLDQQPDQTQSSDLLDRIKVRAAEILRTEDFGEFEESIDDDIYADLPEEDKDEASDRSPSPASTAPLAGVLPSAQSPRESEPEPRSKPEAEPELEPEPAQAQLPLDESNSQNNTPDDASSQEQMAQDALPEKQESAAPVQEPAVTLEAVRIDSARPNSSAAESTSSDTDSFPSVTLSDVKLNSADDETLSTVKDAHWEDITPEQQQKILEEDRYIFDLFKSNGWDVYDNRWAPTGSLWVVADKDDFESARKLLLSKFGLVFKYTPKPGRTRGGKPGWWLANRTVNRGKKQP